MFLIFSSVVLFMFLACCAWWQGGTLTWKRVTAVAVVLCAVYFGGSSLAAGILASDTGQTFRTYKVLASMLTELLIGAGRFWAENPRQEESPLSSEADGQTATLKAAANARAAAQIAPIPLNVLTCERGYKLSDRLWGGSGAFGTADKDSVFKSPSTQYPSVGPVEYTYDGTRGPSDLMTPEEESLYECIKEEIKVYSERGIVCTKVDIVANVTPKLNIVLRNIAMNTEIGSESAFIRLTSASGQNTRAIKAQTTLASENLLRNVEIPPESTVKVKENFLLSASKTSALPGDIVSFEAVTLGTVVSADALLLAVNIPSNSISQLITLVRDTDNIYRGSFTFEMNDLGVFEFSAFLTDYKESTIHHSNKVQVLVNQQSTSFVAIIFRNFPLVATQGNTSPIELTGVTWDSRFYNVANPVLGTTYEIEDSRIATVSNAGFLEAHAPGRTKLYAHYAGYTADVDVIVLSKDTLPEIPEWQKPANPVIISPLEGTVINGATVVFEVTSFDISKGHTFSSSKWQVRNQLGQDAAYLESGDSNTARWIASEPGTYQWSMKYYYDGFNTTEPTPWTTFIVSGDIDQPAPVTGVTLNLSSADIFSDERHKRMRVLDAR